MSVKILLTKNLSRPVLKQGIPGGFAAGDDNPLWNRLVYMMLQKVFQTEIYNGTQYLKIDGVQDLDDLTVTQVKQLAAVGAEVLGYPAFVALSAAQFTSAVPDIVSNPYQEDGVTLKTWQEWCDGTERENAGTYYVELNGGSGGAAQPGTVIRALEVTHGLTVLSAPEVRDILPGA